jgi:proteasome accessory factor C
MASADRLNRILGMIPFLLQNPGVPLSELAEEFQVRPAELLRDLEALSNCSYGPFGSAEIMDAYIEDDRVHLWTGEHFKRPLSFTPGELLALRTAVSLLLTHTDAREVRDLARAYRRIAEETEGGATGARAFKGILGVEPPPELTGEVFSTLERSVYEGRKVRISYFTEHRGTLSERKIAPYRMVCSDGRWYVVANCEHAQGVRTFRADHVRSASLLGEHFEVPEEFQLEDHFTQGVYVETEEEERIVVRYRPPAAQWVLEEEGRGRPDREGAVTLSYRTSSPRWLLQRVFSYGRSAEILEPVTLREEVRAMLERLEKTYREGS